MDKINVLIVDDSLVMRGMLTSILEADSHIVVIGAAANAEGADLAITQNIVDVVTLDIEMPGRSGLDYLPSLIRRHIPTVMLSSRTAEGSEEYGLALSLGASACFNKAHAVRDGSKLLNCIKQAATRKSQPTTAPPVTAPVGDAHAALELLIARHGAGLTRFIAERIGYATLEGDEASVTKWLGDARRLEKMQLQ